MIERLTQRGVAQYAITNFGVDAWALFRPTFPILDHMKDIVVSGAERLVKPGEAIFDLAAQRFGHSPESMLFIDDNAANVEAARRLGWHAFHFEGDAAAQIVAVGDVVGIFQQLGLAGEALYLLDLASRGTSQQYGFVGRLLELAQLRWPRYRTRSIEVQMIEST